MKRINSVTDALNTNKVLVDVGDGILIPLPTDGVFAGSQGKPGVGVPDGGTSGQVVQKTASGTIWATPSKELVGLTKVDNTADLEKPLSEPQAQALTNKADLIGGKVPTSQLPAAALVTDETVAPLINGTTTGAAIDARINTQVAPQVQQITANYIAGDRAVADAAAAAVNANPKIAELEAAKWVKPAMAASANLNDFTSPGDTPVPTAAGKIGLPTALPGILQTRSPDGANVIQEYTTNETVPKTFRRRRSAGSWSVWTDEAERPMSGRGALPAGTDLNSLNLPNHNGNWALTGPNWSSYINLPTGITVDRGTLEVISPNNWTVTHRIYPSAGTKRYERIMTSPAPVFGPWQVIDTAPTVPQPPAGGTMAPHSSDDWVHWGDSLTDDAALGADAWVAKLAALTGKNHINGGWYGQLAAQIAGRQGGNPALMTVDSGRIPAAGTAVKVLAATPHVSMPVGVQQPTRQVPGTLAGRTGYLYDGGADVSDGYFMPTSGTASTVASGPQQFLPTGPADTGRGRIMTICIGENDIWSTGPSPQHVAYMARQMHDYQSTSTKRVLVLSIPDRAGNATGAKVRAINEALKAEFPSQFLDVAGYLRTEQAAMDAGITFTADDLADIAGGFTPRVFRLPNDGVHYNALACSVIAPFVYAAAKDRGWVA